ncbi:hypothetical protein NG798_04555 [Ancylothrix sp. C2]|uniref:hypothetical protein n=1 Tax=Ancylothrix sp. D3o TaxID=2953691 RepID=UPI0021BBAE67|nr:hypothetical protein [Ancylothrix sp. D3o]MCT7949050.1 hypothetical protein [Ancylothrix sp. D3o]
MSLTQLTLNIGEGSVSFSFTPQAAKELQASLAELMQKLRAVSATKAGGGTKPTPQKPMEYQYTGDIFLEIFCNPNIWPTPFAAKLLISLRDDRIRLTTEAELTRVIEDLNHYLDSVG